MSQVLDSITPGGLINIVGGALILILGVVVFAIRPRRRTNQAFAMYCVGFAVWVGFYNALIGVREPWTGPYWVAATIFALLGGVGMHVFLFRFPTKVTGVARSQVLWALAATWAVSIPFEVWFFTAKTERVAAAFGMPDAIQWQVAIAFAAPLTMVNAIQAMVLAAALRFRSAGEGDRVRLELTLVAAGLVTWQGILYGAIILFENGRQSMALVGILWHIVLAGMWLWAARGSPRTGRNMALWLLGLPTFGLVVSTFLGGFENSTNAGLWGFARTVAVAFVAFAIIRHQVLGIDVKVRRGISRGTIAALFIAVFFVASESTAQAFEGTNAGPFVGIAVAGVLVFFLAPLQRWAERFAAAATADARPAKEMAPDEREQAYLRTAMAAWADGHIDRREREMLDLMRTTLGLTTDATVRLEAEAARGGA